MHDLVVAERQDEALVVRVQQRERHLVVVVATVDRVEGHVAERVVHPAEVPLVTEAQPARRCRRRHARPRRRLLGDHQHVGELLADHGVRLAQEAGWRRGSPAHRTRWAPSRRRHGSSRGTASTPPRRRAARRCGTRRAGRARWRRGSCAPRCARSRTRTCPTRDVRRAGDRGARTAACRRTGRGSTRHAESAPAPSRRSRRCRAGASHRRSAPARPDRRSGRSARSTPTPDSPTSRRTDARPPATARRG